MSFLRRLRNPKKSIVLAAALFSICGLVFAAFSAFTSSGMHNPGPSDGSAPNNAGNSPSHPWLPGDVADNSTSHNTPAPQGPAHGPTGQPGGQPTGGSFPDDSQPPPSGPANLQGPDYGAHQGGENRSGGDLPPSSIFGDEGPNFASAGGAGGSGGGGSGGGNGEKSRCDSLIGCTSGSPQKDNPEGGKDHPDTGGGNGDPGFTPTTPVPEPETYAMLLAGLGVMGAIARRRKQRENTQH